MGAGTRVGTVSEYSRMARDIARQARPVVLDQFVLTTTLSTALAIVPSSLNPPGTHDPATGVISWTLPVTATTDFTFTYQVQPSALGVHQIGPSYVSFTDSAGKPGSFTWAGTTITVTDACLPPTPTPTLTPTATDTPTPTNTPTATAVATATPTPVSLYLPILLREPPCDPARRRLDVVLALDTSSSMTGAKFDAARGAAAAFLDALALPDDRAAIVAFHEDARIAAPLTGDRAALQATLDALTLGTGTRLDRALTLVGTALPPASPDRARVAVLLTDGRQTDSPDAAEAAAAALRDTGATLFAVGLGDDVDGPFLARLAGDEARYYPAPDPAELESIYLTLATRLPCPADAFWGRR